MKSALGWLLIISAPAMLFAVAAASVVGLI